MQKFTRDHLPGDPDTWEPYRKVVPTPAVRIQGPFIVATVHDLNVTCDDGWLAVDAEGFPYPIDAEAFDSLYVRARSAANTRRELCKVLDAVTAAARHHVAKDTMNAELHLAGQVRHAPLTVELQTAVQTINQLIAELP